MDPNYVELIILFGITFIALFVFAITGLGPGIIIQIGYWSMAALGIVDEAKLSTVLIYLSFSKYPMGMLQSLIQRKYILFQFKIAIILFIFVLSSTLIGIFILVRYQSPTLVRCLGALLLVSLIISFCQEYCYRFVPSSKGYARRYSSNYPNSIGNIDQIILDDELQDHTNNHNHNIDDHNNSNNRYIRYNIERKVAFYDLNSCKKYVGLISTSILSGFSRGLYGVGGPPFMIYQLITNFDRTTFRSLMAFADGFGSGLITMVYLWFIEEKFDSHDWLQYLVVFIAAVIGLFVGNVMAKYVDQHTFKVSMRFLLFCGSINLILVDLGMISVYASASLAVLFVVVVLVLTGRLCFLSRKRKGYSTL